MDSFPVPRLSFKLFSFKYCYYYSHICPSSQNRGYKSGQSSGYLKQHIEKLQHLETKEQEQTWTKNKGCKGMGEKEGNATAQQLTAEHRHSNESAGMGGGRWGSGNQYGNMEDTKHRQSCRATPARRYCRCIRKTTGAIPIIPDPYYYHTTTKIVTLLGQMIRGESFRARHAR